MAEPTTARPAFTLRFKNERTHRALKVTAEVLGVPMSEIAEAAIEHELAVLGADLEDRLSRTVELLRSFRRESVDDDIERFAEAEVAVEDPLRSHHVSHQDPLGVSAAFARSME